MLYKDLAEVLAGGELKSSMKAVDPKKTDLQTVRLFVTLAVLTILFVFGVKWLLLTPEVPASPPGVMPVESASK